MPRHEKSELVFIVLPVLLAVAVLGGLRWAINNKKAAPVPTPVPATNVFAATQTVKKINGTWQDIGFSRGGQYFVTACEQNTGTLRPDGSEGTQTVVRLWDAQNLWLLNTLARPNDSWCNFVITDDNRLVGVAGWKSGTLKLFNLSSGAALGSVALDEKSSFYGLNRDGSRLIETGQDWVRISRIKPFKTERTWKIPNHGVAAFCQRKDGGIWAVTNLLPAPIKGPVEIWDLPFKGESKKWATVAFPGANSPKNRLELADLTLAPDEKTLALAVNGSNGAMNGQILLFDAQTAVLKHRLLVPNAGQMSEVNWTHNGRFLAIGGNNSGAFLWDLKPSKPRMKTYAGSDNTATALAFTPDDKTLVFGGNSGPLHWQKLAR